MGDEVAAILLTIDGTDPWTALPDFKVMDLLVEARLLDRAVMTAR